jgi:hypothetical protein
VPGRVRSLPGEQWRPVDQDTRYLVSNLGRVIGVRGRLLTGGITNRGYRKVSLGKRGQQYVHILVARAFLGETPDGLTVDHVEQPKTDNRATNLRWLPHGVNSAGWHATHGIVWNGRWTDSQGRSRNLWTTPDDVPEGHEPLTGAELEETLEDLKASGW